MGQSEQEFAELGLPEDGTTGTLIGRAWLPATMAGGTAGPSPVVVREDGVYDLSGLASTVSELLAAEDALTRIREAPDASLVGTLADVIANTARVDGPSEESPYLLAPVDLRAIKAAGVTFAKSLLERVIEERAGGDPDKAEDIRTDLAGRIGADLSAIVPGSPEAMALKDALIAAGLWSQYLEVGIGPDAEIFTKCQPMAAVGPFARIGIHPLSTWNNPEPEIVLIVAGDGRLVGATLGNDVNLRDFEGRSALLLSKAKDNNGSCALGPFIRLLDETFTVDDIRAARVSLEVTGDDGFRLEDGSSMSEISRDVLDLVSQSIGPTHQYPDGFALFTGTMFAPTQDRGEPGKGFTHAVGDVVTIATEKLGRLRNIVDHSDRLAPWTFGAGALMRNLAARGLL